MHLFGLVFILYGERVSEYLKSSKLLCSLSVNLYRNEKAVRSRRCILHGLSKVYKTFFKNIYV